MFRFEYGDSELFCDQINVNFDCESICCRFGVGGYKMFDIGSIQPRITCDSIKECCDGFMDNLFSVIHKTSPDYDGEKYIFVYGESYIISHMDTMRLALDIRKRFGKIADKCFGSACFPFCRFDNGDIFVGMWDYTSANVLFERNLIEICTDDEFATEYAYISQMNNTFVT